MTIHRTIGIALLVVLGWTVAPAQVWERVPLPGQYAQGYYLDVFFLPSNPQYGWVCGFNGYVLRTTDGGSSWQGSVVPFNGRAGGHLESVHFTDALNGYCSGPCGVFRSTDGGATWTDITPTFPSEAPWGCYFISATTGVVLGGGCVGAQNFFRTTNGGQTWSLFQGNQSASGLTDALLQADGSGYAVSSGLLWQTTDGGSSWSVAAATGPNYWNEEIARSGTSFLIPWAGSNCSGQGSGGGGRFSTDGGQTWRSFSTGTPMFGAFLHDSQRGWICGYARHVWYTSDAGQNWQYRGCGTDGDLDDIWMITDTTGFVVGQGVYRYAKEQRSASKTMLDYGWNCQPVLRYDTVYIRNRSWNATSFQLTITGSGAAAYSIVQPATQPAAIPPCDSLMVVVRFQPSSDGRHSAVLTAVFSSGTNLTVLLNGERISQPVTVADTLVEVVGVPAGEVAHLSVFVDNRSTINGQVSTVTRLGGSTFLLETALPLQVPAGGNTLRFSFVPPDTGWYAMRLRIRTEPCSRDTTVTLRVYARSPIINAQAPVWNSVCNAAHLDSVLVTNTGNSDLVIGAMGIEPIGVPLAIVGTSRGNLPIVVPPGESLWVHVRYDGYGSGTAMLVLDHNDRTLVRNVARPLRVVLSYGSVRPSWQRTPAVLDFGTLCAGQQSRVLFAEVVNTGSPTIELTATVTQPFTLAPSGTVTLAPTARTQLGVSFAPTVAGAWTGYLTLAIEPCGLADTIALRGRAETTLLDLDSSQIRLSLTVGQQRRVPILLRSSGSAPARVVRITLDPPDVQWQIRTPTVPRTLQPQQHDTLWLEVSAATTPAVLNGRICVAADSLCTDEVCIPVYCRIEPLEFHRVELDATELVFSAQRCQPRRERTSLELANTGTQTDTVTAVRIEPADAPFVVVSPPLPIVLRPGDRVRIEVEYAPTQEGMHTADLVIECPTAWNTPQRVPMRGQFVQVSSTLEPARSELGVLEPCSPVQQVVVTIHARGMLADTLELRRTPAIPAWTIPTQAWRIAVEPNDSASVVLEFDPSNAPVGLPAVDRFQWESSVCPQQLTTVVEYTVVRPRLAYAPVTLTWDAVMQQSTVGGQVVVRNPGSIPRTIVGMWVIPSVGDGEVQLQTPLPLSVAPGEQQVLDFTLTPRSVGNYRSTVYLVERSVCSDTIGIELRATVREEHYWGRLSIRAHTGLVGDTVRVPVLLSTRDSSDDALWRAYPSAIGFAVTFDPFVLEPVGAEAKGTVLPIEAELGTVRVRVPRQGGQMLGATDTLAYLWFVGLQSPPLRSELHFSRSWAETPKPYTIEHDDGMVVLSACVAWMKVVLVGDLRLWVLPNPTAEGGIATLVAESAQRQIVGCTLYAAQGQLVRRWQFAVEGRHEEPLVPLASGVYYLRLDQPQSGQHAVIPIVVVR